MSLQINPTSVHLGKNADGSAADNRYVADYVPVDKNLLDVKCQLPAEVVHSPGPTELLALDKACAFTFPDVLALPPTYNPNVVQFSSCQTLNASSEIRTTAATKNTTLSLVASGPTASTTGGPADCSLKLVGFFDVSACATFEASSDVVFAGAARGSNVSVVAASAPSCGSKLTGVIDVAACEGFTATSNNITYGGALKGSYLNVAASSIPNCGIDLSGYLNVNACETFDAKAAITMRGEPVKKSVFTVTKASVPNCGFNIEGDVLIEACTDFTATSSATFTGAAVKSNTLKLVPASQPNCGVSLVGDVLIDACSTFTATSNLKIGGNAVSAVTPISITSTGTPTCGFALNGELNINACTSASVTVVTNTASPGSITLRTDVPVGKNDNWGKAYSTAKLVPRGTVVWQKDCDIGIMITMDSIDLAIPSFVRLFDSFKKPPVKDGCSWDESDSVSLFRDYDENSVYIGGSMPVPCFVCDSTQYIATGPKPYLFTDLELKSLSVNDITANQCCTTEGDNKLDMCFGRLQLLDQNAASVTLTATQLQFVDSAIAQTRINSGYLYMVDDTRNTAVLEPSSLSLFDGNQTDTQLTMNAHSLVYNGPSGGSLQLDADDVVLTAKDDSRVSLNAQSITAESDTGLSNTSTTYAGVTVTTGTATTKLSQYSVSVNSGTGSSTTLDSGALSIVSGASSVYIDLASLSGKSAYFQPVSICVGTETKTAYVLMTAPE